MLERLKKLFARINQENKADQPEASVIVTFNSQQIRCSKPNSKEESITWDKLDAVLIETTDEGPMLPDVFWLLLTKDMSSGCIIPQGATGEKKLFEEMQMRLSGFDYEMFIKAMSSTVNQRFLIWERDSP